MLGKTACQEVTWVSNNEVQCKTSAGTRAAQTSSVNTDGSMGMLAAGFSYDAPAISHTAPANGPTKGGIVIEMHGHNFGDGAKDSKLIGRIGGTACDATTWLSKSAISCALPAGTGGMRDA